MVQEGAELGSEVERGRRHYAQRRWADAFEALQRGRREAPLARADLDRLVWSAALVGDDDELLRSLEMLYQAGADAGDSRTAARAAFWLGFRLFALGAPARASGWLARARRQVEGEADDCAERGFLLLPTVFRHLAGGAYETAEAVAREAAEIGQRCREADLLAIARNLEGRALVRQGCVERGLALLDEAMVAVTAGDLSPLVTGLVYCNVLTTCRQACAFDRASEWTAAFASWCEEQPQLVAFTGHCLVHRSEILQLSGDWPAALEEVRPVCEHAWKDEDPEAFADACYQRGELLRLRGELSAAEVAYQRASRSGRDPQPGLALLRLVQGRREEAVSAIERVVATTAPRWQRASLLPALAEIMLAAGEIERARDAADELETIAADFGTEILAAVAAHVRGALRLAEGDPKGAMEPLRHAFRVWHRVGAPHVTARIRTLLAAACRALGDRDGADLELEAARTVFAQLGAEPDLTDLVLTEPEAARAPAHHLSRRELEVLRLVARGATNRAIAAELGVSVRTIERHVSNIFSKIDVASRAAATAFAYRHELV